MVLSSVERNIMKSLRKRLPLLAALAALFISATLLFAVTTTTRYLHVRVSNPTTKELVRVNVPLMLAEKIIPAINHGQLRDGKIQCGDFTANSVNIRAILDALKTAPEGEFVSVQQIGNDVHVAKEHGQMVVHVMDKQGGENVDVTVPWEVAQALITDTREDQLNVEAAIKALENIGDTTLVRVTGKDENVRVWVDSRNSDE
jgi:ribonuclease HI